VRVDVALVVNQVPAVASVDTRATLAEALRDGLGLTGTHLGCEHGVCGSCTVIVDGRTARSCLLLAVACQGRSVTTVEGLAAVDQLHRVQAAFSRHHALQCGFCTPGFLMTVVEMLAQRVVPDEHVVRRRLSGNLCRCTGYQNIVAATVELLSLEQ
jgi:carbon-monoxide dehydrogenase small subunit